MTKVATLQEYRHRRPVVLRDVSHITISKDTIINRMALSPNKQGAILISTNNGVYEWDIIDVILEKISCCIEGGE